MNQRVIAENRIELTAPKIGAIYLSKFAADFDHGLYAKRPWHVVTFGRNFATVEECIAFVQGIVDHWDDAPDAPVSDQRNATLIDHGYNAYAREEGHFD